MAYINVSVKCPETAVTIEAWPTEKPIEIRGTELGGMVKVTIGGEFALVDARKLASACATIKPDAGITVLKISVT